MVEKPFQILQWNVGKKRETQLSLLNDQRTNNFDIILVQEPHKFTPDGQQYPIVIKHHYWEAVLPSKFTPAFNQPYNFRSMIYINKRLQTRQIVIDSSDLTAVLLKHKHDTFLILSVYVQGQQSTSQDTTTLQHTLHLIRQTIHQTRETNPNIQLIIGGDFNRHHEVWGGPLARYNRSHEAEPILEFIGEFQLWSALPQGTATFRNWGNDQQTTIDLMLISSELQQRIQACKTHEVNHGSDHSAIFLTLNHIHKWSVPQQRRSYHMADWDKIRQEVRQQLQEAPPLYSASELDQAAEQLETTVQRVLQHAIPPPKPFPYAKRWWTYELTQLRREYNHRRNQWTSATRRGDFDPTIRQAAYRAKVTYHNRIASQKKQHWQDFLEDQQNVWKALACLNSTTRSTTLTVLQKDGQWFEEDAAKAEVLLQTFFPQQPEPQAIDNEVEALEARPTDPIQQLLTDDEVERAIFNSNPRKAPGPDDIPFRVWQELWPVVKHWVTHLYRCSIHFRHLPKLWAEARIVVIRKPGKPDYSVPKAHRPISLLRTISKGLEKAVALRLSEYLERTGKLSPTQFGARPRRSTDQALTILVEKVYDAWRAAKVLSLVTFDVQGAYNGVNKEVLQARLSMAGIPRQLVRWIYSFCSNRRASIAFGSYESEAAEVSHPGLPQGSPLSPILYILYNGNLLRGTITREGGDMGFVDDYTAWVVGTSSEANTKRIQTEIIPRVMQWERESGATFEADKTQFIHFSRNPTQNQRPHLPLSMSGADITPIPVCKILGVHLDEQLRMRCHVEKATRKAMAQATALSSLRGLRPQAMRQLYLSTVASKLDYAAPVWFQIARGGATHRSINTVQRIGSRAIIGAFKTTATAIIESEAGLLPAAYRLQSRVMQHVINLHTLEEDHPWWAVYRHVQRHDRRFKSPMKRLLQYFEPILQGEDGAEMETIKTFIQPPTIQSNVLHFVIREDRDMAAIEAEQATPAIFTDGSGRNGVIGLGVTWRDGELWPMDTYQHLNSIIREDEWIKGWQTISTKADNNAYVAELTAILKAFEILNSQPAQRRPRKITILSDCQTAILSIRKPRHQSGQYLIKKIWRIARHLYEEGLRITLQWTPAHEGVIGNEMAHKCAQKATKEGSQPVGRRIPRLKSKALQKGRQLVHEQMTNSFDNMRFGKFTRELDRALPGTHMTTVYNQLTISEAKILAQLRTNHSGLNSYLGQIGVEESTTCACGTSEETIPHFLFYCRNWVQERAALRVAAGERWADLAYMLGGWSGRQDKLTTKHVDGPKRLWKPNMTVIRAVIQFVKATWRFQPKALVEEEGEDRRGRGGIRG
jgi:ribonuclease HI/exonuclease III